MGPGLSPDQCKPPLLSSAGHGTGLCRQSSEVCLSGLQQGFVALPSAVEKLPNALPADIEIVVREDVSQTRPFGQISRDGFVQKPADGRELEEVLFISRGDGKSLTHGFCPLASRSPG